MYKYNPSHIVIGGDFNVDFSRTNHNTNILFDFIINFNILLILFVHLYLIHTSVILMLLP